LEQRPTRMARWAPAGLTEVTIAVGGSSSDVQVEHRRNVSGDHGHTHVRREHKISGISADKAAKVQAAPTKLRNERDDSAWRTKLQRGESQGTKTFERPDITWWTVNSKCTSKFEETAAVLCHPTRGCASACLRCSVDYLFGLHSVNLLARTMRGAQHKYRTAKHTACFREREWDMASGFDMIEMVDT
jgi:hypothetical protein